MPGATDLPFAEAIRFFRNKVNIPTRRWDDLWQADHARGFMIAGAMKADLLSDFRGAIDKALSQGTTIADFRKDFDAIVERHGWSYNGGRNWRTRVIFDTNLRTAYAAGRWDQIQRTKSTHPYLRYVAVIDPRTRDEHRAWHGTVLPADDPWWRSHYPPNGWNCRCTVQQLSDRDLERFGYTVDDQAPPSPTHPWTRPGDGAVLQVPEGIDPGFGYNVGEAAQTLDSFTRLLDRLSELNLGTAATAASVEVARSQAVLDREWSGWLDQVDVAKPRNQRMAVHHLTPDVVKALEARGISPESISIEISDRQIAHALRDEKSALGGALPLSVLRRLPAELRAATVYFDKADPALIYAISSDTPGKAAKAVVRVNLKVRDRDASGRRGSRAANDVRTLGLIGPENLDSRYEGISGRSGGTRPSP